MYTVQGAVSNYYTEYLSEALSPPSYFRTKVGGQFKFTYIFNIYFALWSIIKSNIDSTFEQEP